MKRLKDQVVLITGCSTGIGRALALEFASRGHRVMATARNPTSIEDLKGPGLETGTLDVTSASDIAGAARACIAWAGGIDILINNAGYGLIGPMAEIDVEDLRKQFETNVIGLVALTQAVIPHMAAKKKGRIVNIGSVSGLTTAPFGGAYSGSKAAVHLLADAMRMELAPLGIDVVTVQPGAVSTKFSATAGNGIERFKEGSLYSEIYDAVETRARFSDHASISVGDFARKIVDVVTRKRPPAIYRLGAGSRALPLLARLPSRLRDHIFARRFGLTRLGK